MYFISLLYVTWRSEIDYMQKERAITCRRSERLHAEGAILAPPSNVCLRLQLTLLLLRYQRASFFISCCIFPHRIFCVQFTFFISCRIFLHLISRLYVKWRSDNDVTWRSDSEYMQEERQVAITPASTSHGEAAAITCPSPPSPLLLLSWSPSRLVRGPGHLRASRRLHLIVLRACDCNLRFYC